MNVEDIKPGMMVQSEYNVFIFVFAVVDYDGAYLRVSDIRKCLEKNDVVPEYSPYWVLLPNDWKAVERKCLK